MPEFNLMFGILVAVVIGILEAIKRTEIVNHKYIPLISLAIGIPMGIIYSGFAIQEGILAGIMIGLGAVGLYSGTTNVVEGIRARKE